MTGAATPTRSGRCGIEGHRRHHRVETGPSKQETWRLLCGNAISCYRDGITR